MAGLIGKSSTLIKTLIRESKPILHKVQYYAKVELVPPKLSDIPVIRSGISKLIHSAKTGQYKQLTVREAWLNSLVAIEIYCWFFIGECIGKRHLIGYDV